MIKIHKAVFLLSDDTENCMVTFIISSINFTIFCILKKHGSLIQLNPTIHSIRSASFYSFPELYKHRKAAASMGVLKMHIFTALLSAFLIIHCKHLQVSEILLCLFDLAMPSCGEIFSCLNSLWGKCMNLPLYRDFTILLASLVCWMSLKDRKKNIKRLQLTLLLVFLNCFCNLLTSLSHSNN